MFEHPGLGKKPEIGPLNPEYERYTRCRMVYNTTITRKVFETEEALKAYKVPDSDYALFLEGKLPYQLSYPNLFNPEWVHQHQTDWKI